MDAGDHVNTQLFIIIGEKLSDYSNVQLYY